MQLTNIIFNYRQDSDHRQSIELRDLQPALDYRVRVASGNQVDLSPFTQAIHFTTQQEGKNIIILLLLCYILQTFLNIGQNEQKHQLESVVTKH